MKITINNSFRNREASKEKKMGKFFCNIVGRTYFCFYTPVFDNTDYK